MRLITTGWLLALLLSVAPALAQEPEAEGNAGRELLPGQFSVVLARGYDEYALPVANGALGRDWALLSNQIGDRRVSSLQPYSWQIGHNYSTVPIRVDILHRQPLAFRGRIEILSAHGFANEEAPLGSLTLVSREVLVPPSQPKSYMLLPRVCPPSQPGGVVRLEVRIYSRGQAQPSWSGEVFVWQLEPAYVYSLKLDGPEDEQPSLDELNFNNQLQLELSSRGQPATETLTSSHYILNVDRRQVTLAPLACRDFAFVTVSLGAVRQWPEEEQAALTQFLLGGGHLCLFDADGQDWLGLETDRISPVGRGWLLPVSGDLTAARAEMQNWLEGELAEFTLWAGGTVAGQASVSAAIIGELGSDGLSAADMLAKEQAARSAEITFRGHVPGYLNPIWIYREACHWQASEPWDSQEFVRKAQGEFELAPTSFVREAKPAPRSVHQLLTASRNLPPAHWWLAGLVLVLLGLGGSRLGRRWYTVLVLGLLLVAGASLWWRVEPFQSQPIELKVYDADIRIVPQVSRSLQATTTSPGQPQELRLESTALLRAVHWDDPQGWEWQTTLEDSIWRGTGTGDYLALSLDAPVADPGSLPVKVQSERLTAGKTRLEFDTSALRPDQPAWLLTPLGWSVIPAGSPEIKLEVDWPTQPIVPGATRLQELDKLALTWFLDQIGPNGIQQDTQQLHAEFSSLGAGHELESMAWRGLTDVPGGLRGLLVPQAVLFVPCDEERQGPGLPGLSFLRIAIPLDTPLGSPGSRGES